MITHTDWADTSPLESERQRKLQSISRLMAFHNKHHFHMDASSLSSCVGCTVHSLIRFPDLDKGLVGTDRPYGRLSIRDG